MGVISEAKKEILYGRRIPLPVIDSEKCVGCGECVRVCPAQMFELHDKKARVDTESTCIGCGHCWSVCPEEAVSQKEAVSLNGRKRGPDPAVSPETFQLLIRQRRSVRLFTKEPVPKEQLERMIDAGRYGPTGTNRQDINYIVLPNQAKVDELRTLVQGFIEKTSRQIDNKLISFLFSIKLGRTAVDQLRFYTEAYKFLKKKQNKNAYIFMPYGPAVIVAHAQSFDYFAMSTCAIALYNCTLMANTMGLGCCFLGFTQVGANMDKRIRRWLNIPKDHQCYGAMIVGYPDINYLRLVERMKPNVRWL